MGLLIGIRDMSIYALRYSMYAIAQSELRIVVNSIMDWALSAYLVLVLHRR